MILDEQNSLSRYNRHLLLRTTVLCGLTLAMAPMIALDRQQLAGRFMQP